MTNERESAGRKPQVTLFCTNGDGTVNCSWCDEVFDADLAQPDGHDEPICPECARQAESEVKEQLMKLEAYTVTVRISDPLDEDAAIEATFHNCPREDVLAQPLIGKLVKAMEENIKAEEEVR